MSFGFKPFFYLNIEFSIHKDSLIYIYQQLYCTLMLIWYSYNSIVGYEISEISWLIAIIK